MQALGIRQDRVRVTTHVVAVPDRQERHQHGEVVRQRRLQGMAIQGVRTGQHRLEVLGADGELDREPYG